MKLGRVEIPKVVGKTTNHFGTIIFNSRFKEFFYEFDLFYDIILKVSRKELTVKIRNGKVQETYRYP
jgi:dihydropteroate synthase